jgi:hypothetical protein
MISALIGLCWLNLIVSSQVFKVVIHLYNSALFWHPLVFHSVICCSQFYLYLLSISQLVLLSTLPKILLSFCGQKGELSGTSEKFRLDWCQSLLVLFSKGLHFSSTLYTFLLENFWTKVGVKMLFSIPSTGEQFGSFCWISCSLS